MASFWTNLRRCFFGWEKFSTLDEFIMNTETINDLIDYSKQHFIYEPDVKPEDEWQEPHHAFLDLQSPNTPADCEDFGVVFDYWFKSKGYTSWLLAVWDKKSGHAVCVYQDGNYLYYLDNWFRPRWRFSSIAKICFDIYPNATMAKIAKWNNQQKRYTYTENINLKA